MENKEYYITKLTIDRKKKRIAEKLPHLGAIHSYVEDSLKSSNKNNERSRKLWSLSDDELIILSECPPDCNKLSEISVIGSIKTTEYNHFLNLVQNGMLAKFSVTLSPIIRSKKNKKHCEKQITQKEELISFILKLAEDNGFIINKESIRITASDTKPFSFKRKRAFVYWVTYSGILQVTNEEKFKKTLVSGMGRKKAYGCGLLKVIPIGY